MKLITLNLQGFVNWEERSERICHYLAAEDPDIILFQEVVFLPDISSFTQVELLNRSLKYPYQQVAVPRLQADAHHQAYREGLGVLSKYPVTKSEVLVLKQAAHDPHQRIVQFIDLSVDDRTARLANVHFSLSTPLPDFASEHIRETFGLLEARSEQRIVAGDFNIDTPEIPGAKWAQTYTTSKQTTAYISQVDSVVEGGKLADRCTDHIWIPRAYAFEGDIQVSDDSLSDHRAVVATIRLI